MPPTTSDRFFALADRVEAALSGVGIPAELTGALRSYWEQPTAPRLAVLVETANRLLFVPINEGTLDRLHPAILAYRAIDDAVGVFYDNDHPDAHAAATAHLDQCERLLARDPLLPVRLVDGVWTTEGAGSAAKPTERQPGIVALGRGAEWPCSVILPPRPATDYARAFAEYNPPTSHEVTIPITVNPDDWREFVEAHQDPITVERDHATGETSVSFEAEATCPGEEPIPVRAVVTWTPPRRIFAAVEGDGSGVWAIGDSADEARAGAVDHQGYFRDCARSVGLDYPPPETDAAWLDTLTLVTLSGATESLRALIKSMETGDPVAPWCPADLWDYTEPTKEP